ncbi:MAG: type II toxin-antitoxin system RelE/ParE family toxin [Bacteroidota bacterium]
MAYKIEIRPLATIEIIETYDWYELQREGLGLEFLNELDNFYITLQRNPEIYSYYEIPVRQGILNRFPYTIIYETIELTIVIYSVFMYRQNPDKKRSR